MADDVSDKATAGTIYLPEPNGYRAVIMNSMVDGNVVASLFDGTIDEMLMSRAEYLANAASIWWVIREPKFGRDVYLSVTFAENIYQIGETWLEGPPDTIKGSDRIAVPLAGMPDLGNRGFRRSKG